MTVIRCPYDVVVGTVDSLRTDGYAQRESVVLWLGKHTGDEILVVEAFRPAQVTSSHRFWIPAESMDALRARLRHDRLMIAAQVHTHPEEAFHSDADDLWAIVRHEGALSLVVPDFCAQTTAAGFLDTTKVFRLHRSNAWREVAPAEVHECLIIG